MNWTHGGSMTIDELRDMGRLEVTFDRRLLPGQGDATGINQHTFVVQYKGVQENLEFLPLAPPESSEATEGQPELVSDCHAVFEIDPRYLDGRQNIAGNWVYVTLECDFILDCHEQPVDGNLLAGRWPTGSGTPGGVFKSWFYVEHEEASS